MLPPKREPVSNWTPSPQKAGSPKGSPAGGEGSKSAPVLSRLRGPSSGHRNLPRHPKSSRSQTREGPGA